jgi:hypothetical protein
VRVAKGRESRGIKLTLKDLGKRCKPVYERLFPPGKPPKMAKDTKN